MVHPSCQFDISASAQSGKSPLSNLLFSRTAASSALEAWPGWDLTIKTQDDDDTRHGQS